MLIDYTSHEIRDADTQLLSLLLEVGNLRRGERHHLLMVHSHGYYIATLRGLVK